jgi:hypothetical protein
MMGVVGKDDDTATNGRRVYEVVTGRTKGNGTW